MRGVGVATPAGLRSGDLRWPARLDWLQSGTGVALALFMLLHSLFAASILLGPAAMRAMARAFEGEHLFGRPVPAIVVVFTAAIALLVVVHGLLALRKVPGDWREYARFRAAMGELRHGDTTLWHWQVLSGLALFFLVGIHLWGVVAVPGRLDPYGAAGHVWTERGWLLHLVLLPAVWLHVGIGLYRLALKWGWVAGRDPARARLRLRRAMWALILGYVALGLVSLGAYVRLGIEHAPPAGERPAPAQAAP